MSALGINRVRRVCPSAADYLAQPARVFDGICTEVGIGHIDGILILSLTPKPSEITKKVYYRLLNVLVSKKKGELPLVAYSASERLTFQLTY